MYKYSNKDNNSVDNLTTGATGINPGNWMWKDYQDWVDAGGITQPWKTDQEIKDESIAAMDLAITTEEDSHSYAPFLHSDGHTYKVSPAIQNTRMRLEGADPTAPMNWDDVNGVTVQMTVGQFVAIANAVYDRGAANYYVAKEHKAEMRKLDNPSEYDYSTGWY